MSSESSTRGRWSWLPSGERGATRTWQVLRCGRPLPQRAWLPALADDVEARAALGELLRAAPFAAYFWETPPLVPGDDGIAAALALTECPALARTAADPSAFAARFAAARGPVATFANVGGDSILVAPLPAGAPAAAHLAAFVRSAPADLADALWRAVGAAVVAWMAGRHQPLWVSTSGLAVPWLHVRLDGVPKYYTHRPYADAHRP